MSQRRRRVGLLVASGLVALTTVDSILEGPKFVRRLLRRRALHTLIDALAVAPWNRSSGKLTEALVGFEEPEAVLALAQLLADGCPHVHDDDLERSLIEAVTVHATGKHDPRIRAALEALATRDSLPRRRRFVTRDCLEETKAIEPLLEDAGPRRARLRARGHAR